MIVGVIGGSGFYELLSNVKEEKVNTIFGSARVYLGEVGGRKVAFIPRHGKGHVAPPHSINYRANILALRMVGVERVIASNAVGSLRENVDPGSVVIPHDFIDFTKNRVYTFFDGKTKIKIGNREVSGVVHISMTPSPYCPELRQILIETAREEGLKVFDKGVYVCTEGSRFETAAEIKAFRVLGGDLVGMTGVPEVVLARELAMCYATVCVVTNYAAGIMGSRKLTHTEVKEIFNKRIGDIKRVVIKAIERIPEERKCFCSKVLEGAIVE